MKTRFKALAAAVVLAASAAGIAVQAVPAHASVVIDGLTLNGAWRTVQLHAFSGGGCADYSGATSGSPIISDACESYESNYQGRLVTYGSGYGVEFTIGTGPAYAVCYDIGWVFEPASDSTTILAITDTGSFSGSSEYYYLSNVDPGTGHKYYAGPNGANLQLKAITSPALNTAGWAWIPQ